MVFRSSPQTTLEALPEEDAEYSISWADTSVSSVFTRSCDSLFGLETSGPPSKNKDSDECSSTSEVSVLTTQDLLLPPNVTEQSPQVKQSRASNEDTAEETAQVSSGAADDSYDEQAGSSCLESSICPRFIRVASVWNKTMIVGSTWALILGLCLFAIAQILQSALGCCSCSGANEERVSEVVLNDPIWSWDKHEGAHTAAPTLETTMSLQEWAESIRESHGYKDISEDSGDMSDSDYRQTANKNGNWPTNNEDPYSPTPSPPDDGPVRKGGHEPGGQDDKNRTRLSHRHGKDVFEDNGS